jgi:hypothetical protein
VRWLITFLFLFTIVQAEEITTGNLITNGNFETGNSNGWTTSGDVQVLNDCCELNNVPSNYDLEFGDSGSISQDFKLYSNDITQDMLDNGITLNSTIEVQNGECNVTGCWGGQGAADTFTNELSIKDSNGNILASNTNIRTDVTGIDGANFSDTLIYNGTGSSNGNITISGSDANAPAYLGGPNLDNISVTMTYDDSVLATEIVEEIENIFEEVEEVFEELEFVQIEELFEEFVTLLEEPPLEEELSFEPVLMVVEEMPMEEEVAMEVEEEITMEVEEAAEEEEMIEEEIIEEEPQQIAQKPNEEEEIKEEEPTSETANKSPVSTKKITKQKKVQSKTKTANVESQSKFVGLEKAMDKVDKDIKDISKNLQIKNIIKLDAMASEQASLDLYNVPFYKSEDIYLDQMQIQDLRQLYADNNLDSYVVDDPMFVIQEKLNKINIKKQQILIELEQLKNG